MTFGGQERNDPGIGSASLPVRLVLVDDHEMVIEGLKAMLAADSRGVPFVIMQGRLGGSAMAAAAVNALATEVE